MECLLELWEITEQAEDGSVLKTKYVEDVWVPFDPTTFVTLKPDSPNQLYVPKSTDYEGPMFR